MEQQLKSRHLTPEQFFKEGPVPEDTKRADFRETVLIGKFTKKAIEGKLGLANKEIDDRVKELMTLHENAEKQGRKQKFRANRKTAIEMLRQEKYTSELQNLVREHFVKMSVECPAFPDLESVDVIFPPR